MGETMCGAVELLVLVFFYYTCDFFIIPNLCLLYLILLIPEIASIINLRITNDFGISLSISIFIIQNLKNLRYFFVIPYNLV